MNLYVSIVIALIDIIIIDKCNTIIHDINVCMKFVDNKHVNWM